MTPAARGRTSPGTPAPGCAGTTGPPPFPGTPPERGRDRALIVKQNSGTEN